MFWRIGHFPELSYLEPPQRAAVLRRVPWWTYPFVIIRAAAPAIIIGAVSGGLVRLFSAPPINRAAAGTLASLIIAAALFVAFYLWQMRRVRTSMRREIAAAFKGTRLPFCFACGYDLRLCETERCPECGVETNHD